MINKISIMCVLASAVLILPGCSTAEETVYDITGNWLFTFVTSGGTTAQSYFTFAGAVESGSATDMSRGHTGSYSVNNQAVTITLVTYIDLTCGYLTETITGSFSSADSMSGTYTAAYEGPCWLWDPWVSWQATRL